jgi:hypothetical protein
MRDLVRLIRWTVVDLVRSRAALEAEMVLISMTERSACCAVALLAAIVFTISLPSSDGRNCAQHGN